LDSIANEVNRNNQLLGSMTDPLIRMLDLLSPKLVVDYIGEMFAESEECADTEIRLVVLHKEQILDPSIAVFRQIFNAFSSYIGQTNLLSKRSILTWPTPGPPIESSLNYILSSIVSALLEFLGTASKVLSSFVVNMGTLVDLPEQTFLSSSGFARRTAYNYINLIQFAGDTLRSLASELDDSPLGQAIDSQLSVLRTFAESDMRQIQRGILGLLESNRNLQLLITQLMRQLVTATPTQAVTIQQQIDDAEDQVNRNSYIVDMLRNIVQKYTSITNDLAVLI